MAWRRTLFTSDADENMTFFFDHDVPEDAAFAVVLDGVPNADNCRT